MAQFEKKPSIIDALQFTGGADNARGIIEGVNAVAPDYTVRWQPQYSEFGLEEGEVREFPIPEKLTISNTVDNIVWTVAVGSWVMVTRLGVLSAVENNDFVAQYQSI